MKKYELLKEQCIEHEGRTLYRIKALKDFSDISAGDIGGYVESEYNLSHHGSCWVYDDAKVYDRARVYAYAKVYDKAQIYGNAMMFGNAEAYDKAKIYDYATIFEHAIIYGNSIVHGNAKVHKCAEILKNAVINKGNVISKISMPYKDIFQFQCEYRVLTAILTEDNKIIYSIGCQHNIDEEEFIYQIYNTKGGLDKNPHRKEYLRLIKIIKIYFEEVQNG